MPKDFIARFQDLGKKIVQLQKQIDATNRENERLKAELEAGKEALEASKVEAGNLQQQLDVVKTLAMEHNEKSRQEFSRKLQQYLKDIDEVIAHLNHT